LQLLSKCHQKFSKFQFIPKSRFRISINPHLQTHNSIFFLFQTARANKKEEKEVKKIYINFPFSREKKSHHEHRTHKKKSRARWEGTEKDFLSRAESFFPFFLKLNTTRAKLHNQRGRRTWHKKKELGDVRAWKNWEDVEWAIDEAKDDFYFFFSVCVLWRWATWRKNKKNGELIKWK
jgi:hypothetical protein